jgi:HprK-related kinase A
MRIGELSTTELGQFLVAGGLNLKLGPFVTRIHSDVPELASHLRLMYAEQSIASPGFADFHVRLSRPNGLRRWFRPQVLFNFDGSSPFKPLPLDQAFAMLEWGLNWCISNHMHTYLILHAAVLERGGHAVILPAPPGSGKSTLTAALCHRGWRLFSDELALIDPRDLSLVSLARPVSLKNQSIELIRNYLPEAVIGPVAHDTVKGTVAHLRPPADSVRQVERLARPSWLILPHWQAGAAARLSPLPKGETFIRLLDGAFNYSLLGEEGFRIAADLVEASDCFEFTYSSLDDAIETFSRLTLPDARQ